MIRVLERLAFGFGIERIAMIRYGTMTSVYFTRMICGS